MDHWTDKCTDTHTYTEKVKGRFHQHPISSVWSPLYEQKTLISTSKPAWASRRDRTSQGKLKGSHCLYWAVGLIFNVYLPFCIMASFFLSDTPLTFLLLMLFYPFLVFFLFIFFKLAYWLHLILMQSHTESKTSTQSSGFSWFKSTIHFYHNINFTACNLTSVVLCNTFISYAPILRI